MESEIENWTAKAEAWRRHADLSRKRAAIVRKVAGMMRGTEPLPDGLTRAALVVCGTAWRGFEWVRQGVEVSPAVWEVERNSAADKLALYAGEVARETGKVSDAFHAADALAALRGESLTPPAEWTSPAIERLRPIRDAVAGTLDALNEEGEAWRDFEAAYLEALEAVPVEEIEAARARLAAEDAAATAPLRVEVSGPVEVEGVRAVAENAAAAALAAKQEAQEARRTREAVEQQGAAVVGAVREVGAKVGENGKAKPRGGKREKMPDWSETETDAFRTFARYATGEDFPDGRTQEVKDAGGWDGLYLQLVKWLPDESAEIRKAFRRVKSGTDLQRLRKAAIYRVNNPAK